jgi:hypothetical protein
MKEYLKETVYGILILFALGVIFELIGIGWTKLNWQGWISEGTVNTSMCITTVQLPPNTLEKYYKPFTCEYFDIGGFGSEECVHVDWSGSSCEIFYK